jgi:hypothetical protein
MTDSNDLRAAVTRLAMSVALLAAKLVVLVYLVLLIAELR